MNIDRKTYWVECDNYYQTKNVKNQIIVGISQRKDDYQIKRLLDKELGKSKDWNTYTISRYGKIYQHFPSENHSNYLGIKKVDIQSISIVLENMGALVEVDGVFYNWLNEICDSSLVEKKDWVGYEYWEKIPKKQFDSLFWLLNELTTKYNIPKVTSGFLTYNRTTPKFRGICFVGNHIENSLNINPLIDYKKIDSLFKNE